MRLRPDVLAEHVAAKVRELLAARDAQLARQAAAVADLQKQVQGLQHTVAALQRHRKDAHVTVTGMFAEIERDLALTERS